MTEPNKGVFMPLHKTQTDPTEPDWDIKDDFVDDLDLNTAIETETSNSSQSFNNEGISLKDHVLASILSIKNVLNDNIDLLNRQGADLFKASNYAEALETAEQGKKLASFNSKVLDLHSEWLSMAKEGLPTTAERSDGVPRQRRSAQKLIVKFADGESFFENSAAETFAKAIGKIGVSRVESLGLRRLNNSLISLAPIEKYQSTFVDGRYVITHFGTDDKRRLLLQIAEQLDVSLQAELVD
jgi:hypothetical protein